MRSWSLCCDWLLFSHIMLRLRLVFVVRCNIFNFTIQNVTECIDGVHTDTLIILQAVYQGLTEMVFFMKCVLCNTSFLHGKPQFIIFNQRLSPPFSCLSLIIGLRQKVTKVLFSEPISRRRWIEKAENKRNCTGSRLLYMRDVHMQWIS